MRIRNKTNELVISIPKGILDINDIQDFLDFLRYKILVSKSKATEKQVQELVDEINLELSKLNKTQKEDGWKSSSTLNILISTLLSSDGVVGTFLLKDLREIEKYSCYYLYIEIFDKKDKIIKYSGLSEAEVLELLYLVLKRVQFINENQISEQSWGKAKELTEDIDVKDVSFVALTIEMGAKLWTGDMKLYKGLRKQGFMDVVSLEDLKEVLKK